VPGQETGEQAEDDPRDDSHVFALQSTDGWSDPTLRAGIAPASASGERTIVRSDCRAARPGLASSGMLLPRYRPRPHQLDPRAVANHVRERHRARRSLRPAPVPARADDPDVHLDVPHLRVDKIELKVEELTARLALDASVLDLVLLHVGVEAQMRGVDLNVEGVDAQALLDVRLDNLVAIVDRAMRALDRNP
jgi:hypothetical protein